MKNNRQEIEKIFEKHTHNLGEQADDIWAIPKMLQDEAIDDIMLLFKKREGEIIVKAMKTRMRKDKQRRYMHSTKGILMNKHKYHTRINKQFDNCERCVAEG